MDRPTAQRARALFDRAAALPLADREAFVRRECGGDSALAELVLDLLEHEGATLPLSAAPTGTAPEAGRATMRAGTSPAGGHLAPGSVISRYRVESVLGEGGMGVVYVARQEKPDREVALKVIRPGYATPSMLRRFEYEAEVLGRLLHPGIAQIYEAGVFTSPERERAGLPPTPFFAMELVKGVSLTKYASEKNLSTRQRLELLAKICDAVQHAHQKGVIHRDLKPGNILVVDEVAEWQSGGVAKREDGPSGSARSGRHSATSPLRHLATSSSAQPKILDFGVARATDSDIQSTTMQTDVGAIIGTIPYMSPEQVGGDPNELDTRSDVYALGVIAYELLVGRLPYDLSRKMIHEAARIIREEEPTRLSSIDRTLRGDVETIVGHALEKDKARRYSAASALAADIRRYLSDEPIAARPASTWYQVAKFSKRNKGLVGGIVATFAALTVGMAATGVALSRENEQRVLAQQNEQRAAEQTAAAEREANRARLAEAAEKTRADELKEVSDFQEHMLGQVDPARAGIMLEQDLIEKLDGGLTNAGLLDDERASRVDAFRSTLRLVNRTDAARDLIDRTILRPAIETINLRFKDQPTVDATLRQVLAHRYKEMGKLEDAERLQRQALEIRRRTLGDDHADTLRSIDNMGIVLQELGRLSEAERFIREGLERARRVLGDDHIDTLVAMGSMGTLLVEMGRPDQAEPYLREALERSRRNLSDTSTVALSAVNNLAVALKAEGRLSEAQSLYLEAIERSRRVLGEDHPDTLRAMLNTSGILMAMKKFQEAEPVAVEVLRRTRQILGEDHPVTLKAANQLGCLYYEEREPARAEPLLFESLERRRRVLGDAHPDTLSSINNLTLALEARRKFQKAEPYARELAGTSRRTLGDEDPRTLKAISKLASLLEKTGKFEEAERLRREVVEVRGRVLGQGHTDTITAISDLGSAIRMQGRLDEAERLWRDALEKRRTILGPEHPDTLGSTMRLGFLLIDEGKHAEAEAILLPVVPLVEGSPLIQSDLRTAFTKTMIKLYSVWDKAEPGKGYDAKAAEWKAKLDAITPPPEPAAKSAEPK